MSKENILFNHNNILYRFDKRGHCSTCKLQVLSNGQWCINNKKLTVFCCGNLKGGFFPTEHVKANTRIIYV